MRATAQILDFMRLKKNYYEMISSWNKQKQRVFVSQTPTKWMREIALYQL